MKTQPKYSPELRERAIRMVYEQREQHDSLWAAIESVAGKIGCTAQTLNNWIRKAEHKAGPDATVSETRVKELEREESRSGKIGQVDKWKGHWYHEGNDSPEVR